MYLRGKEVRRKVMQAGRGCGRKLGFYSNCSEKSSGVLKKKQELGVGECSLVYGVQNALYIMGYGEVRVPLQEPRK